MHAFTAMGSICALFSVLAMLESAYERMFLWLLAALVIDAVDGTMARAVRITEVLPRFSGERLDLVIDYLTYVFVPVLALLHAGLLTGWAGQLAAGLALLSALYHFSDTASKADDNCFVGFPAVWNLVAFCLFGWDLRGPAAISLVLLLVGLTFVPMHWLHPLRVRRLAPLNLTVMTVGLGAACWIIAAGFPAPLVPGLLLLGSSLYFGGMALVWGRASMRHGRGH
ncbi:MAG: phosphatidylcholine/phosphatidylserine synthase [Hyphomicrobiaceae bacterium]